MSLWNPNFSGGVQFCFVESGKRLGGVQINLVECNLSTGNRLGVFVESKFFWWSAILTRIVGINTMAG